MSFNNFTQMEHNFQKNSILAGSAEHHRDQVGIREERSAHNLLNRSEAPHVFIHTNFLSM